MTTPAKAEAAASLPVFLINSRREVRLSGVSFINDIFSTSVNRCQFKKSGIVAGASRTSADKRSSSGASPDGRRRATWRHFAPVHGKPRRHSGAHWGHEPITKILDVRSKNPPSGE